LGPSIVANSVTTSGSENDNTEVTEVTEVTEATEVTVPTVPTIPSPTAAQVQAQMATQFAVDAITEITIKALSENYQVWHLLVVYAGDLFLVMAFGEVGGAFLDYNNPGLFDRFARDSLLAIYLAYMSVVNTLGLVVPEGGMCVCLMTVS
jgi:hypothetical protein